MNFQWQKTPYRQATTSMFCDVPGVGRLVAERLGKGQRRFIGKINNITCAEQAATMDEVIKHLEHIARTRVRRLAASEGVPPPLPVTDLDAAVRECFAEALEFARRMKAEHKPVSRCNGRDETLVHCWASELAAFLWQQRLELADRVETPSQPLLSNMAGATEVMLRRQIAASIRKGAK